MNRFHAPEGGVTEQSVRMAHNYEYMVPVETAWELERGKILAEARRNDWRNIAIQLDAANRHGSEAEKELALQKHVAMLQIERLEQKLEAANAEIAKLKEGEQ